MPSVPIIIVGCQGKRREGVDEIGDAPPNVQARNESEPEKWVIHDDEERAILLFDLWLWPGVSGAFVYLWSTGLQ